MLACCMAAQARSRPTLTVTIDADHMARLKAVVDVMPGAGLSAIVDEMLAITLPMYEAVAEAVVETRQADGAIDQEAIKRRMEAFVGATILKQMGVEHNTDEDSDGKGVGW